MSYKTKDLVYNYVLPTIKEFIQKIHLGNK